jgi:hypothetical protein
MGLVFLLVSLCDATELSRSTALARHGAAAHSAIARACGRCTRAYALIFAL